MQNYRLALIVIIALATAVSGFAPGGWDVLAAKAQDFLWQLGI